MTNSEKRTVRLAATALGIYLALFLGWQGWKKLEAKRSAYEQLLAEAQKLKQELQPYENRVLLTQKLKDSFHLDPQKLSKTTLVAEASAALQKAATSGGVLVGPIRESPARASAKELATIQLEGIGPVPALMGFFHRLETLGYPLVIDLVQFTQDAAKPGPIKVHLTIVILNFEQWKNAGGPRA